MKTAEVAIEHILAGVLALCAFVLPLLGGLEINSSLLGSGAIIGVLGISYLFGVVFDKVADTILSPLEEGLRLSLAKKNLEESLKKNKPCFTDPSSDKIDPFPQDLLEYELRNKKDGRLEWMDSLRSRLRTSRGLAVLGLPASLGIVIYLSLPASSAGSTSLSLHWWPHSAVALNLVLTALAVKISAGDKWKIPKTYELCEENVQVEDKMQEAERNRRIRMSPYILLLFASAVSIGIISAFSKAPSIYAGIGICGSVISLLALWVWYRIDKTYMNFVLLKMRDFPSKGEQNSA